MSCVLRPSLNWNGDLGRGCDEAEIGEEKGLFHRIRATHSIGEGFGRNSAKKAIQ